MRFRERRIGWQLQMLRELVAARRRYERRRDWLTMIAVYAAHAISRLAGGSRLRCRVPLPRRAAPVTVRLGTSDFQVFKEVFVAENYAFAQPLLAALDPPVSTVVDLGANIGLTLRLWSQLFPGCAITAVEPDEANLALAVANAGAAARARLQTFGCFVAAAPGVAQIDRSQGAWAYRMSASAVTPGDRHAVAVRTLPEILALAGLTDATIDLLKCDIEGAEAELFHGGPPWLSRVRAVLAEVHGAYSPAALAADVRAAGGVWESVVEGATVLLVRRG